MTWSYEAVAALPYVRRALAKDPTFEVELRVWLRDVAKRRGSK